MIHSKSNGFTLIEVLLAMTLVGVVLTPIYSLQNTVFTRVLKMVNAVERMFVAYDFFLDEENVLRQNRKKKKEQKKITKKIDDPSTELIYEVQDVPKDSALQKNFNNLYIEKTTWDWQEGNKKRSDQFINILFEPPMPKKQEKKDEAKDKPPSDKQGDQDDKEQQKGTPQSRGDTARGGKK
ncbi:MAG: prepilin-type N-terminal cleavage/methylation domain-containing protein [Candidatus Dependentiae bacterium]